MPGLVVLIVAIAVFSLTLSADGEDGAVRTGMQGLAIYLLPDFHRTDGETVSGDFAGCDEPAVFLPECFDGHHGDLWFLCKR